MIAVDPVRPDPSSLDTATDALRRGDLVLLPTETVYGIAADPGQPAAMQKLYAAKGRDFNKPVAYFIHRMEQIENLGASCPAPARKLADQFWPGPMTLVLPAGDVFLGFRMPDYAIALELAQRFGPMAVTSANRSGAPDALTAAEAEAIFGNLIAVYLDAGPSPGAVPSTVIQVFPDQSVRILRKGALSAEHIEKALR